MVLKDYFCQVDYLNIIDSYLNIISGFIKLKDKETQTNLKYDKWIKNFGKHFETKNLKIKKEEIIGGAQGLYLLGQIFEK